MNSKNIWILEDDESARYLYQEALSPFYQTKNFENLKSLHHSATETQTTPDLLIADLRLPDGNFLDYFRGEGAKNIKAPFMVVSGLDDIELLRGCFDDGAIDYLSKPFTKNELIVKLERYFKKPKLALTDSEELLGVEIDPVKVSVSRPEFGDVTLTAKELQIVAILKRELGRYVTRNDLIKEIWGDTKVSAKTLDVHLFNLRRKVSKLDLEILYTHPKGFILLKKD